MIILLIGQIQNPDFENWSYITRDIPFAWDTIKNTNANCFWEKDNTTYRIGSSSIKITINNPSISGYSCAIGQAKGITPNTTYNISTWIYDNDPNVYARLYVACYDNNQNQVDWSFIGSNSSDNPFWQQISGTYTTPANCNYIDIQIRTYGNSGSINVDGVSLTTGSPPSELNESFNSYPPSQWIEVDLGNLLQMRASACPFSSDNNCFGIKFRQQDQDSSKSGLSYLMTDTLDFSSIQPETLLFYWRVNTNSPAQTIPSTDSIKVEISTDLGNSWNSLWKWNGSLLTTAQLVSIPLDSYNGLEQVLIRFSFYKNSTSGSSTTSNRYFNVDSVKVKNSYISRFNRLTNSSFETWLYTTNDMFPNYWRKWNNTAPEDNGRTAQLWIKRDTFRYSGNYSLRAFFTTILNPFIEQKFSNPFNNCSNYPISEVDSFVVISNVRFYDNDTKAKARTGIVWYYLNNTQSDYPNNYTTNQTNWQLYQNNSKFIGPKLGGNNFDSIAFRIRFYNEGSLPNAEDGGLIYVDSVNFKIYCYVGNITPIDVVEYQFNEFINYIRININGVEISAKKPIKISIYSINGTKIYQSDIENKKFINLKKGVYVLLIYNQNKMILKRRLVI
ncbi:MAG: T9SS type A sorting domain-containing protein [candidate division WOR-3 bacterium]